MIDLMIKEYPSKHSEYSVILQERERQRIAKEYSVSTDSQKVLFHVSKNNRNQHILYIFVCFSFVANAAAESSEGGGQ